MTPQALIPSHEDAERAKERIQHAARMGLDALAKHSDRLVETADDELLEILTQLVSRAILLSEAQL